MAVTAELGPRSDPGTPRQTRTACARGQVRVSEYPVTTASNRSEWMLTAPQAPGEALRTSFSSILTTRPGGEDYSECA